jgi:predicted DNA-binding transcriptional regulator YafY
MSISLASSKSTNSAYKFRQAILSKQQIACDYHGLHRELCPHTLGHTNGRERALSFQFAEQSSKGLPPEGEWRCMNLDEVTNVKIKEGPWHTGSAHTRPQTCVKQVDVEVAH